MAVASSQDVSSRKPAPLVGIRLTEARSHEPFSMRASGMVATWWKRRPTSMPTYRRGPDGAGPPLVSVKAVPVVDRIAGPPMGLGKGLDAGSRPVPSASALVASADRALGVGGPRARQRGARTGAATASPWKRRPCRPPCTARRPAPRSPPSLAGPGHGRSPSARIETRGPPPHRRPSSTPGSAGTGAVAARPRPFRFRFGPLYAVGPNLASHARDNVRRRQVTVVAWRRCFTSPRRQAGKQAPGAFSLTAESSPRLDHSRPLRNHVLMAGPGQVHLLLYAFDPAYVLRTLPELWSGLRLTLAISAIGIAGSLVVGLAGGALRTARVPIVGSTVGLYVELFRNTP